MVLELDFKGTKIVSRVFFSNGMISETTHRRSAYIQFAGHLFTIFADGQRGVKKTVYLYYEDGALVYKGVKITGSCAILDENIRIYKN
jgi:hypothetical protein